MYQQTDAVKPRFNKANQPDFFRVLNQRVDQYFRDNQLSKKANWNMVFKTTFMVSLYFIPFILMITGLFATFWSAMAMWALMGLGMAGIGLCVMHDANHGAYSKDRWVNKAVGFIINFMGSFHGMWKIQHNVLHHSYTNIHGFDEDTDNEVMRFSPEQQHRFIYRFQAFYAPFFYCLMSLNRFLIKDFKQVFSFKKAGLLKGEGLTFGSALAQMLFHKTWYVLLTIGLPTYLLDLSLGQVLIGFLMMHFICGIILALIFQSAHIIEETDFFVAGEDGNMENNWAIHQVKTTANFANTNALFSWFIGGLNFQIEHHLFPNICHVHYRHLSKIVRATTQEYQLPYHQHTTFFGALRSHFVRLHQLGQA
ncbi:MAG: acyl-CoA desaturase [Bacteroidota bacterium]